MVAARIRRSLPYCSIPANNTAQSASRMLAVAIFQASDGRAADILLMVQAHPTKINPVGCGQSLNAGKG
jgi:hypothetical protein